MRPATDSAFRFSRSAITILLGSAAALNGFACARLEPFRQKDHPALGALLPSRGKAADNASKSASGLSRPVDAYAQSVKNKRSQAEQALMADREGASKQATAVSAESLTAIEQEQELHLAANRGDENPRGRARLPVTLAPPVPLDDQPVLAADTSPRTGRWEPRVAPEESHNASASAPVLTPPAASEARPPAESAETIVSQARARLEAMGSYQVHLNRQERVGAKLLPVEDVLLSVRRNPKAVRLEWPDGPHKGREVIYSASENGGLMQVNMADSPVPVPRLSLPPDSPLVMSNSRHPITEAGFDTIVHNLESAIELEKAGTPTDGKVEYAGLEQPDGLDHPCQKLLRVTPSGETWLVYIDPKTKLPALVQASAADGSLLERYLFLDPRADVGELSQAEAFDVSRRWGPPKGLLSRFARAGAALNKPSEPEAVTR